MFALRGTQVHAGEIERVELAVHPFAVRITGSPIPRPGCNRSSASHAAAPLISTPAVLPVHR